MLVGQPLALIAELIMNHFKQKFEDIVSQLDKESSYWLIEDFKAIEQFLQHQMISDLFAESEFTRLIEEATFLFESKINA